MDMNDRAALMGAQPAAGAAVDALEPEPGAEVLETTAEVVAPEVETPGADDEQPIKGLTPHAQELVDKRIAKEVGRRKEALDAREVEKTRADKAEARVTELEAGAGAEAFRLGLDPAYLSKPEAELLAKADELADAEAWLVEHWDGYEGKGTPQDPSYEPAQIRARYAQVKRQLATVQGKAQALKDERLALMRQDMERGRKLRLGPKQPTGAPRVTVTPGAGGGEGGGGSRPLVTARKQERPSFDAKAIMDKGATPETLEAAYRAVI